MADNLVGYSRAGDAFHYRWAAKRCLKLIYPNTNLNQVIVEGSSSPEKDGEYVIDLSEYYGLDTPKAVVKYFQLKHTTVQQVPFLLSDLEGTFSGFSERFKSHLDPQGALAADIDFTIVTNRPFNAVLKTNIELMALGKDTGKRFFNLIKKYTGLSKDELELFCSRLTVSDSEGDYLEQKAELRVEMAQLIAGSLETPEVDALVALVSDRVLPNSNGRIVREDVLKKFGIFSDKGIFPAESSWEPAEKSIDRSLYAGLLKKIKSSTEQVIVHAPGGVGKSFFCRYVLGSMEEGSVALAYDCFGAGKYRNRSETRHKHSDGLVQLANELAARGLCEPLIFNGGSEKQLMQMFLMRLAKAVGSLRKAFPSAVLVILIDAADNAEMAAEEFGDYCFASELLKEDIPEGCHLATLCRTERIGLLKPSSKVLKLELAGFTEQESLANLRQYFSSAKNRDGKEFHRLTFGNPRVQANALHSGQCSLEEVFSALGPGGTTVEDQIATQLQGAINRIKEGLPENFQRPVQSICTGLATLTPNIPIEVLALAAGVSTQEVKSFVSDIGRSLWVSESSVQFRDEPTETWFRQSFLGNMSDFEGYIAVLEPLAGQSTYIAEALPQLYLQAGRYEQLISAALSERHLPENNPIDARNVLVYRLHFAFKAALKMGRTADAVKLALRAGEEVAGDQRQVSLMQADIHLLTRLLSPEKIHEIAMRRLLGGRWDGAENVYSASLLSAVPAFEGEARAFARSAKSWIRIYFDSARKRDKRDADEKISMLDVLEHASMLLNLEGAEGCMEFLMHLTPDERVAGVAKKLCRRLIDEGRFATVEQLLLLAQQRPFYVLAIVDELHYHGYLPPLGMLKDCFAKMGRAKKRIALSNTPYDKNRLDEMLSLLEVGLLHHLPSKKILDILAAYVPERATGMLTNHHITEDSQKFIRALAIRCHLRGVDEPSMEDILPPGLKADDKNYDNQQKVNEAKRVVNGILPWYLSRLQVMLSRALPAKLILQAKTSAERAISQRYVQYDSIPVQIARAQLDILKFATKDLELKAYYQQYIRGNSHLFVTGLLNAVHLANRLPHLRQFKDELELNAYGLIGKMPDAGPEDLSEYYIMLAKAVLVNSVPDASAYFEDAIAIVSKFGEELSSRWDALMALGEKASESQDKDDRMSYRFIRTAELVGNNVREKHFPRGEAIRIAVALSPGSGIAGLSRWRDRDIGDFPWLNISLMKALLESGKVEPLKLWALSPLCTLEPFIRVLEIFIGCERVSVREKTVIVRDALERLLQEGVDHRELNRLGKIAIGKGVEKGLFEFLGEPVSADPGIEDELTMEFVPDLPWDRIAKGADVLSDSGIQSLRKKMQGIARAKKLHFSRSVYWIPFFKVLTASDLLGFIDVLLNCAWLDRYDCTAFFKSIPADWTEKRSFQKKYPEILERLGAKYATELTDPYRFENFSSSLCAHEHRDGLLAKGIFQGLVDVRDIGDAESLFGFAKLAAPYIDPIEAKGILDFGLGRVEIHIEDPFGDGPWEKWLEVSPSIDVSLAHYLWSALAAPDSQNRWRAAHCLRKLAKLGHAEVIDIVFSLYVNVTAGAFGSKRYPFYFLHARLYLLIAANRIALDEPGLFLKQLDKIGDIAIQADHIVLQCMAARLALAIEGAFAGSIAPKRKSELSAIGKSSFEPLRDKHDATRISYWHERAEVKQYKDFHFGYDFYRYWLGVLADVFAISNEALKDLTAGVIVEEWKGSEVGYEDDPRAEIWNKNSHDYSTSHDHGSYPRTDNLDFYQSYHAMMVMASRLLKNMPVVIRSDYKTRPWNDWLEMHLLTREDGYWISDWRDAVPEGKMLPSEYDQTAEWPGDIAAEDFFHGLFRNRNGKQWINLKGYWKESSGSRYQKYHIASALVSPQSSHSLLHALSAIESAHDYKLPDYGEDGFECDIAPFLLEGWLLDGSISKRLDEYDPFADQLMCPPIQIGEDFIGLLELKTSKDYKRYFHGSEDSPVAENELWTSAVHSKNDDPEKQGIRFSASMDFLSRVCALTGRDLIIEVQVKRDTFSRYSSAQDHKDRREKQKIYLLSADGKIRSTEGNI